MQCQAIWFGERCPSEVVGNDIYCLGDRVFIEKCKEIDSRYGTYFCERCFMSHSHERDASLHD